MKHEFVVNKRPRKAGRPGRFVPVVNDLEPHEDYQEALQEALDRLVDLRYGRKAPEGS